MKNLRAIGHAEALPDRPPKALRPKTNRFWLLLTVSPQAEEEAAQMWRLPDGLPPRAVTRDIGGSRYPHLDRIHQLAMDLGEPA
jgi:hypothetical protein